MKTVVIPDHQHPMIERSQKRWHLVYYLRVFDCSTEQQLGHVVDVTTEGLMLISETPIPIEQTFKMNMEIPRENGRKDSIEFIAKSLWSKKDINPNFYDTGFRLVEPDYKIVLVISKLIDELKFEE